MKLFTVEQSPSWQQEAIKLYRREGKLDKLCWFVQMVLPPPPKSVSRKMTQEDRVNYRYRTAAAPKEWIPYVPLGDDPERSRQMIEMLAAIFAYSNPPQIKFVAALCSTEELLTQQVYEFGKEWDCVCGVCGQVFGCSVPDVDICEVCHERAGISKANQKESSSYPEER
jgi:hypothetical protein